MYLNGFAKYQPLQDVCKDFNFAMNVDINCHNCEHFTREMQEASFIRVKTPTSEGQSLKQFIETYFDETEDVSGKCQKCGHDGMMLKQWHLYRKSTK